jgi:hypothetical protein
MGNLAWITLALGVFSGGTIMILGLRKADTRLVTSGQINGALKEDWRRTGDIDFHASIDENSSSKPLRLWVQERRIIESAVGQDVVELRWRLATVEEGRELVICWNNARPASPYGNFRAWQIPFDR